VVTALTEVLSLFHRLTFNWLLAFWLGLTLACAALCFRAARTAERRVPVPGWSTASISPSWCPISVVAIVVLLVGLVAIAAAPNNPDSMSYHMARVMHWVQDRSVAHYPTNILRQLYQPPWAEYALLQFQILSGGDRFANLVQWFSMVGSLVGASLIARQLGADHRGQALAAAVAATIPMGILQGSSTQNDYVEAFWLVCLTHYVLQSTRRASRTNACAVGASLALAVLTKGTAYLYAIPLLVWWAAATVRQWRSSAWQPAVIVVVVALSVNAGLYARNLELWGNPLGIGGSNPYAIGMVGVRVLASNAVRAIGLQLGTPSGRLNRVIDRGVRALHVPLRLDVDDPRTTMRGSPFVIRYSLLDDLAGSPLHLALVVMALVLVPASSERRRTRVTYAVALVGVALVFCG
jgi:hypothetical protein